MKKSPIPDAHNHLVAHCFIKVDETTQPLPQQTPPLLTHHQLHSNIAPQLINSTNEKDWLSLQRQSRNDNDMDCIPCYGIHPWFVEDLTAGWQQRLEEFLIKDCRSQLGEVGLHFQNAQTSPQIVALQKEVFSIQVRIACRLNRCLMIHCVKAWSALLPILGESRHTLPALLFHGFTGSPELVDEITRLHNNSYFSISARFLQKSSSSQQNILKRIPSNRLLIESDAENVGELEQIHKIYEKVSRIIGQNTELTIATAHRNLTKILSQS